MKIAFVYPNDDRMVSRGAGYVATMARVTGHDVSFYDTAYQSEKDVIESVVESSPDVLLISASTLLYPQARRTAEGVKEKLGIPVLLGGIHATIAGGEVLEECPAVDYVCVGEGEEFVVEFLDRLPEGDVQGVRNLGYRLEDGSVVVNPVRPATDLDKLPPFDYTLFRQESIVRSGPKPGFTYVFATRGCPYRCTYCCNGCYLSLYGKGYLRTQRVDAIVDELIDLRDRHGAKFLYFGDEMILFDQQYVEMLFRRVKEEVGLPFGCMTRVETITQRVVDLFKETGCCYVSMGVECGDEKFRREFLNRNMTNGQIVEAFKLLRTIPDMFIYAFYMHGFPVSYDAELTEKTRGLNSLLRPDLVQDTVFYPLRGTRLYDYCVDRDLIDWDRAKDVRNYLRTSVLRTERLR